MATELKERIGMAIPQTINAPALVDTIVEADAAGVKQVWLTENPTSSNALTVFTAAFERTKNINLGTSIIPIYPQHPIALAQHATSVAMLAPGRLRLGVGTSHAYAVEGVYGFKMEAPVEYLREYVEILRAAMWAGKVDHEGRFFTAHATFNRTTQTPILNAALRPNTFALAGELTDGAISWNCPVSYLHNVALPAMREGAQKAGRSVPHLVAHVWVALSTDKEAVRATARKNLATYAKLPFYNGMWADAGFPITPEGEASDELIDNLVISGENDEVKAKLSNLLDGGLAELLVSGVFIGDLTAARSQLINFIGSL